MTPKVRRAIEALLAASADVYGPWCGDADMVNNGELYLRAVKLKKAAKVLEKVLAAEEQP